MSTLITAAELDAFMQQTVDPDLADHLLAAVTAEAQEATRQDIVEVADDVVTLPGRADRVITLPQRPVTSVASVVLDGETLTAGTDYVLVAGKLWRVSTNAASVGSHWGHLDDLVVITYSHGYSAAAMPTWVKDIAKAACARVLGRVGVDGTVADVHAGGGERAIVQETAGSYSVTYASAGRSDAVDAGALLTSGERRRLERGLRRRPMSVAVA
ncbi:MAG: hypothetical protein S0880_13125 [Actinomycetota bacterium]|nr:hypothetical protein [Actinomycetota bacterium]